MATSHNQPYHFETPNGKGLSFGIVYTRWNQDIINPLRKGCIDTFTGAGVSIDNLKIAEVPGSVELPLAAKWLLESDSRLSGVVCLGVVIRGDTAHFDYVCKAATEGILQVMLESGKPVIFGVLTVENHQQAMDRAGGSLGNKGAEAAMAALEMAALKASLS